MKTAGLSEKTHKELQKLKIESGAKSMEDLIEKMILEHKKRKLLESSFLFRKAVKKQRLKLSDATRHSHRIRDEIYDEWFS